MPASAVERQADGTVWVYLPKDSDWSERNHLHLYSHNGAQISNDVLIPFGEDHLICQHQASSTAATGKMPPCTS